MENRCIKINLKLEIYKRVRVFILSFIAIIGLLLILATGHMGPWLIDQDYYPPHLTWDGQYSMSESITVNFKTSQAQCGVEYQEVLSDGSLGLKNYMNETETLILHNITLSGLKPNTTYQYKIVEISDNLNSRVIKDLEKPFRFKTSIDGNNPFKFIVFGDNRPSFFGWSQNSAIDRAINKETDISFVINVGDIVLAGEPDFLWRRYFIENTHMRSKITLPTKGNHENFLTEEYVNSQFEANHAFPDGKNWYSYNYSNAHFICLEWSSSSGPEEESLGPIMKLWLRNNLSKVNTSSEIDFVFVYLHYPFETRLGGNGLNWNKWNELCGSEFDMANVIPDAVFAGHVHDYERSRVKLGDYDDDGNDDYTWNIISGGGGAEVVPARWESLNHGEDDSVTYHSVELQHHYCVAEIDDNVFKFIAKMSNGNILDSFSIIKED